MNKRPTLSTQAFFLDLAADHEPEFLFRGTTPDDYARWRAGFEPKFRECLGRFPEAVPLSVTVQWEIEEEGLGKKKILLHTAKHTLVSAIVLQPLGEAKTKTPKGAIVAVHGHGPCGKDTVAGADYPPAVAKRQEFNYDYGLQLAQAGYRVICPDLRPFGERGDSMPGERPLNGRDPCNVHAIKGWLLGFNLLTYNLWDLSRCIDYLIDFEGADPARIGCIGLSGGGAAAMHSAAMEPRLSATAVICALNSYRAWGIGIDNFCGTQFLPGMYLYGDHAEICGLAAPRPLHIEIGGFDYGFPIDASMEALERLRQIYAAAGAADRLSSHVGYAGHQYYGTAAAFFDRALVS